MRQLALVLVLCMFSGCSVMASKAPPKTEFDFGPEPNAHSDSAALSDAQLVIFDVTAPAWMDGTSMYYRLAYQNAAVPLPYAESEWVMSPAALLTQRLRSSAAVHGDGGARLVGEHTPAVYRLHSELLEFEQIFDAPEGSHGVLRLRATLEGEGARSTKPVRVPHRSIAYQADFGRSTESLERILGHKPPDVEEEFAGQPRLAEDRLKAAEGRSGS